MKIIRVILIFLVMLCINIPAVQALTLGESDETSYSQGWLSSPVVHIDYVELDAYLDVVEHGGKGKLLYDKETDKFVFNGHRLDPGVHYALISQGGMAAYTFLIMGDGIADIEGNIHLEGTFIHEPAVNDGSVTYLVLYDDMEWVHEVDGTFEGWILHRNHPTEYLYGLGTLW
jgi:hypothetical protein